MRGKCEVLSSRKIHLMEAKIQPNRYTYSTTKATAICPIATKTVSSVAQAWKVQRINFQENHPNGRRDRANNILCSSSKLPLISSQSQPKFHSLWCMHGKCKVQNFRTIPPMQWDIQTKKHIALHMKYL